MMAGFDDFMERVRTLTARAHGEERAAALNAADFEGRYNAGFSVEEAFCAVLIGCVSAGQPLEDRILGVISGTAGAGELPRQSMFDVTDGGMVTCPDVDALEMGFGGGPLAKAARAVAGELRVRGVPADLAGPILGLWEACVRSDSSLRYRAEAALAFTRSLGQPAEGAGPNDPRPDRHLRAM